MPPTDNEHSISPPNLPPNPQPLMPPLPGTGPVSQPQPSPNPYQQPSSPLPIQPQPLSSTTLDASPLNPNYTETTTSPSLPAQPLEQTFSVPQSQSPVFEQPIGGQVPPQPFSPGNQPHDIVPQKYRVFRALSDTFQALKKNLLTFIVVTIIAVCLAAAVLILMFIPYLGVIKGLSAVNFSSSIPKVIGLIVVGFILFVVWYALAYAFMLSVMSKALNSGADGVKSPILGTLKEGLRVMMRVAAASLLVYVAVLGPILLLIALSLLAAFVGLRSPAIFAIAGLVALAWTIVAALHFLLAPYIAIFEPGTRIRRTLGRSSYLMLKGGKWFVIKLILLVFVIDAALSALSKHAPIAVGVIGILVIVLMNGSLVMLYRNRKVVKDQTVG